MARTCEKCNTPLDDEGNCVTCEAEAEGLKLLSAPATRRSGR